MNLGENILLFFSRLSKTDKSAPEYGEAGDIDEALNLLNHHCKNFSKLVSGKKLVDFGCGHGLQSIALVKKHSCSVVGIDSNQEALKKAIDNAKEQKVSSEHLSFVDRTSPDMSNSFDVVISQNSFEHFKDPEKTLEEMAGLLKNSGIILLTFGPPWFAPYGSHMHFFCKVPWINVLFSEKAVMRARSHFRSDGAKRYEDVESGLNKMTIAKFESIISSCSLTLSYKKYECIKGMNWLSKLPLLREFFINHVTVVLSNSRKQYRL